MEERQYLLKITLPGIEPEIWRRFVVPADINLRRLHDVVQIIMGWEDYHLHEFIVGKQRYMADPEPGDEALKEGNYKLGDLVKRKGSKLLYVYDFGDEWEHVIVVEDSNYSEPSTPPQIRCLDGARSCPCEDSGGVYGYYNICEALDDPDHEEHEFYMDWCGDYDRERFDITKVNKELTKYLRSSRGRHK